MTLRREHPQISNCDKTRTRVRFSEERRWLTVERGDETGARSILVCNLSGEAQAVPLAEGAWQLVLWSNDARYGGDASHTAPPARPDGEETIKLAAWGAVIYIEG